MSKSIHIGTLAGLRMTASPNAAYGFVVLWALLAIIAITGLRLPPVESIAGALVAAALHYLSELWHQLGHARAARRVGYPMIGVRFWWILGASIYPKDEPPLPGSIHIRRALGGPLASLLMSVIGGLLYLAVSVILLNNEPAFGPQPPVLLTIFVVTIFFALDNLLFFTLGALLPLGFTDGSTILRWWGK